MPTCRPIAARRVDPSNIDNYLRGWFLSRLPPEADPLWVGDVTFRQLINGANVGARMSEVEALAHLQIPIQGEFPAGTLTATERQLRARATTAGTT